MAKRRKTVFELPYAGVDTEQGQPLLYGQRGDYSAVFRINNPVQRYAADPGTYLKYHQTMLNLIKIVGEGHIVQKLDVLYRRKYQPLPADEFLQQKYQEHFRGREYTAICTYLVLTRPIRKNAFYVFDKKALNDFLSLTGKVSDLLEGSGFKPHRLSADELDRLVLRMLRMDFAGPAIKLDNILAGDTDIRIGERSLRSISLINTDTVDMPETLAPYCEKNDGEGLKGFPMDNLDFLYQVPGYHTIVYNQLLDIPQQQGTLNRLEQKRKRHSGVPDPANLFCVEDIDRLLSDVARENQLLVNAHYNILVAADTDKIGKAANFIEAALFQSGLIPSGNAYNQLELFRTTLPGNAVELKKYDWFLTTADAALCLWFHESLQQDEPSDFVLRFTDRQGVPVAIDPSDLVMRTGRIKNRNRFVLGASGTGKSYCINTIVQQYLAYNMDVVIVDVGHSYSGLCATYGGKYITYSEDRPITMNPFAMDESEYNIEKKDFLITLVSLLWKGAEGTVSNIERDVIAQVISAYYGMHFGMPDPPSGNLSFNSFYEFALVKIPEIKQQEQIPFDLEEFRFVLKKFYSRGEFATILNEAADQSLFNERFIVYEIDAVQENKVLLPIVTLSIIDLFIQKMRHRKNRRKTLILEEAWRAISSPIMANFLVYLNKTVRKFWGEIIEVTQEIGDIIGNEIVKDSIINNSDTIILLQQNEADFKKVAELLSISEIEQKKIFTINKLDNKEGRARFNEFYIRRGNVGEVYGVEVSIYHHLAFTTEKPEKSAVETYAKKYGSYQHALTAFVSDLQASGKTLSAFVTDVNTSGIQMPIKEQT